MLVELMGASGAGKTTLTEAVLETPEGARWTRSSLLTLQCEEPLSPFHANLLRRKARRLADQARHDDVARRQLAIAKAQLLAEQAACKAPAVLALSDEGVLQMFSGELLADSRADIAEARQHLAHRYAVFLTCSPDAVLRNIRERRRTGPARPLTDDLSDDEVLANAAGLHMHLGHLAQEITRNGGTCMRLNADDGFASCVEQLADFLHIVRSVAAHEDGPDP